MGEPPKGGSEAAGNDPKDDGTAARGLAGSLDGRCRPDTGRAGGDGGCGRKGAGDEGADSTAGTAVVCGFTEVDEDGFRKLWIELNTGMMMSRESMLG